MKLQRHNHSVRAQPEQHNTGTQDNGGDQRTAGTTFVDVQTRCLLRSSSQVRLQRTTSKQCIIKFDESCGTDKTTKTGTETDAGKTRQLTCPIHIGSFGILTMFHVVVTESLRIAAGNSFWHTHDRKVLACTFGPLQLERIICHGYDHVD